MFRAVSRRIAALILGIGIVLSALSPANAQTLNIPVESHIRPIHTATLFHEFFADFFTFFGVIQRDAKNILTDPHAEAFSADYYRTIFTPALHRAMSLIVSTLQCEQHHARCSHYAWPQAVPTNDRYNPDTGMIWSAFRPSDDPVTYRFKLPMGS